MLHVRTLGQLIIADHAGNIVELSSKKAQALFLFLACHHGRSFSRQRVAALLWDDIPDAQARTNLRQTIASIRRALTSIDEEGVLSAGRESIGIDANRIDLDLDRLNAAAKSSDLETLEAAVELYDGELADGLAIGTQAYDEWLVSQRYTLREQYLSILTALMSRYTAAHLYNKAIAIAAQILVADDLREEIHVALMELYDRIGRPGAAIKQYRHCQEVLRRELGITPSEEARQVYERISKERRQQRPSEPADSLTAPSPETDDIGKSDPQTSASIAVIPFLSMSADPEQAYFADGLSEEILNLLTGVRELRVAARTSSFQFKDQTSDVIDIGKALNVSHILEGSVRKSASRLRITAQLIDAKTGYHLWSKAYDRELTDVFEIQDEIATAITDQLKSQLFGTPPKLESRRTSNFETYELYLQGQQLLLRRGSQNIRRAQALFLEAYSLDPDYLPVLIGIADSHLLLADDPRSHGDIPLAEACDAAKPYLDQALAIDDGSADLATVVSLYYLFLLDAATAEKWANKARDLNPNLARAYNQLALVYEAQGNPGRPIVDVLQSALELDPLSAPIIMNLGINAAIHLDIEKVEKYAERINAVSPDSGRAEFLRGLAHWLQGNFAQGMEWYRKALEQDPTGRARSNYLEGFVLLGEGSKVERLHPEYAMRRYIQIGAYDKAAALADTLFPPDFKHQDFHETLPLAVIASAFGNHPKVIDLLWDYLGEGGPDRRGMYGLTASLTGRSLLIHALDKVGRTREARASLSTLEETCHFLQSDPMGLPAFCWRTLGFIALKQGDIKGAVEFLKLQFEISPFYLMDLHSSPIFAALKGNPEFEELLSEIERNRQGEMQKARDMGLLPYQGQLDSLSDDAASNIP